MRAQYYSVNDYRTYRFTYNTDPIPHLTNVSDNIGSQEWANFTYTAKPLVSPFGGTAESTATTLLASVARATGTSSFEYDAGANPGAGEMTKATFPYGAYVRWVHRGFTYTGSKTVREAANRYLAKSSNATETNYALVRNDAGDASLPAHGYTCVNDPSSIGQKCWYFNTTATSWMFGLNTSFEDRAAAGGTVLRKQDFTWVQDDVFDPYVGTVLATLDQGQSYQKQSKTEQTLDRWGNATQVKQYDYGNLTTPARTYTHTYLTDANYTARNIRNRLVSSVVNGLTLVTNTYDGTGLATVTGLREHDTANYGTRLVYRGNVTRSVSFSNTRNRAYDITGTAISTDDGNSHTATAQYTMNNAVPQTVTANGLASNYSYNNFLGLTNATGPNTETTAIGYDAVTSRPSQTTSPYGAVTSYEYGDSPTGPYRKATTNNKWVKTSLDGLGRTVKVETGYGTTTVSAVDTVYDSCACSPVGKVKQVSQPYAPGGTPVWTTYTYDGLGRTTQVSHPGSSGTTTYLYRGNLTQVTDPAGKWKQYVSDVFGNLTQVIEPDPTSSGFTPIRVNAGGSQYTDPQGTVWSADYGWTNGHSAYTTTNTIANTNAQPLYQSSTYNIYPLIYSFTAPYGSYTVTLKFAEVYWGGMGQRPMNILLNGTTVETNFDASAAAGGSFRAIDRQYTVSVTTGQIVIELDPVSGSTPSINGIEIVAAGGSGPNLITNYTYDLFNRLTQVSMPRGSVTQTRTFTYDGTTQRLASATNPENGTVTYTYNGDGTLATKIDAKSQKVGYIYDSNQRLTTIKRYPVSTGAEDACQRVTFTYGTASPSNGRLTTASWGGATCASTGNRAFSQSYTYTNAGLPLSKSLGVDARTLTASYSYDNEGKMVTVTYPSTWDASLQVVPGPTYTYTFDSMGRPNKLTDNAATPVDWVKDLVYGPGGEMTQMRSWSGTSYYRETKQYNARLQMTRVTTVEEYGTNPTRMDMEYRYSATQNNGRITSQKDYLSGEDVQYSYDMLNRLITASTLGPEWGQSFTYDGFGNLLQQTVTKGTAPAMSLNVDGTTNRITGTGFAYDANGNMTQQSGMALTYDVENRVLAAAGESYAYGPDNKRVWKKKPSGTEEVYFYGVRGERLGTYYAAYGTNNTFYLAAGPLNLYFAGKLIRAQGQTVVTDRLGSVRYAGGTTSRYFPYGQEQVVTGQDREKFGTYYRDSTTGLDYADQRYYGNTVGRFLTADPYQASGGASDPGSWNRYSYVENDPVNFADPEGLKKWIVTYHYSRCYSTETGVHCDLRDVSYIVDDGMGDDGVGGGGTRTPGDLNTQGGSNRRFIRVTNPSKTGPNEDRIRRVMRWIQQNLDSTCAGWLSGTAVAITGLLGDPANLDTVTIGHGAFDTRTVSAFTGNNPNQTDLPPGYAITVNDLGAFFVGSYVQDGTTYNLSANGYTGGTSQAQVAILLHELAHSLNSAGLGAADFQPDFNNPGAGDANDRLVRQNCQRTLNAARNIP